MTSVRRPGPPAQVPPEAEPPGTAAARRLALARRAVADGTVLMLAGTVVAGLATYAWQAAGAHVLGEVAFAPVATVWTLMFLIVTVLLAPVEQYAIRTVAATADGRRRLVGDLRTIGGLGAGAVVAVSAVTWALRDQLFGGDGAYVAVTAAIVVCFGQLAVIRGMLAGERDFASYGWITGLDSTLRLLVGLPLLLAGGTALALAWTIPLCPLVALAWARHRPAGRDEAAPPAGEALDLGPTRFIAHTVGGTAASQIILAGSPLVVAMLGAREAAVTSLFVTQTAFRALFLIATPAWSRALPVFTRSVVDGNTDRLRRTAGVLLAVTLAAAAAAGVVAGIAAPPVVALLFGAATRPDAVVAGLSMAGTVGAIGNLGLTTMLVALGRTRAITRTWWIALAASAAVVALPGDQAHRVVLGFAAGEVVAALGLAAAVRARRQPVAAGEPRRSRRADRSAG